MEWDFIHVLGVEMSELGHEVEEVERKGGWMREGEEGGRGGGKMVILI